MDRREAIAAVAYLLGGTVIGANLFLESGCKPASKQVSDLFNQDDVNLMNEIADTILPATQTPGAKAAKVGKFMALMIKDCYDAANQNIVIKGLAALTAGFKKQYDTDFIHADVKQRTAFLTTLDQEQKTYTAGKKEGDPDHYFRIVKELTLLGYFTSEIGCTQAMRYVAVPGRYDACVPYKKGDKAWAT